MIKNLLLSAFVAVLFVQCNSNSDSAQLELVWADEFNYSGVPSDSLWGYEIGYIRNKELQKYTKSLDNVRVENGVCVIECILEDDSTISSGSINTFGKRDIHYGRVEVRAKIPSALGSWPAIWLLGVNRGEVGWPACGELDIMEHVGFDPLKMHANVHKKPDNNMASTNKGNTIEVEAPWEDFHVYAMDWLEDHIDFFYDDSLYFSYEIDLENSSNPSPFDKPHYLLMNLAYGGGWGGKKGVDLTTLPLEFKIDYVRVYRFD